MSEKSSSLNSKSSPSPTSGQGTESRRGFIRGSSLLLASALPAANASGQQAESRPRLGLVGCGTSGVQLAKAAMQQGEVELVAMADSSAARIHQATRALKSRSKQAFAVERQNALVGKKAYEDLLCRDLDWVIVAVPYALRPVVTASAIEARKSIYVEQPLASCGAGFARLLSAAGSIQAEQPKVFCGNRQDLEAKHAELLAHVDKGAIGKIQKIIANAKYPTPDCKMSTWRQDFNLAGDGTLRHRAALARLAIRYLGRAVEANPQSQVEYGESQLDSRVRIQFESGQLISRCHLAEHFSSPSEVIEMIGSEGRCELHRGRIYNLAGEITHRIAPQKMDRGMHLLATMEAWHGRRIERSAEARTIQEALPEIEAALMAQAAGRFGRCVKALRGTS
ncbi:MAG: Gfo/Idh/MocA family oxidoreductase [Planctomycetota bacterium]